jgi:hypothetical protein
MKKKISNPNIDQLKLWTPLQVRAFVEGVPYEFIAGFYNEFQLAAILAGIEYMVAKTFSNLEEIQRYFIDSPNLLSKAVENLNMLIKQEKITNIAGLAIAEIPSFIPSLHDFLLMLIKKLPTNYLNVEAEYDNGYIADDEGPDFYDALDML